MNWEFTKMWFTKKKVPAVSPFGWVGCNLVRRDNGRVVGFIKANPTKDLPDCHLVHHDRFGDLGVYVTEDCARKGLENFVKFPV